MLVGVSQHDIVDHGQLLRLRSVREPRIDIDVEEGYHQASHASAIDRSTAAQLIPQRTPPEGDRVTLGPRQQQPGGAAGGGRRVNLLLRSGCFDKSDRVPAERRAEARVPMSVHATAAEVHAPATLRGLPASEREVGVRLERGG